MASPNYLSAISANALISDLRPTTLSTPALLALNSFLDEILISLITSCQSINPSDLRKEGIPSVFTGEKNANSTTLSQGGESTNVRALGRSAVAEAEVELRSWLEGRSSSRNGFQPDGQGNGMKNSRTFNVEKAVDLMRLKCLSYSTMALLDNVDESLEVEALASWKQVGGDTSEDTVEPAALWLTAIIEHVCEHILSQLASVVARDSEIVVAGPQELYTALCEDESIWGLFKKMKVKDQLEEAIRAGSRHKRSTPSRPSTTHSTGGRSSPLASGSPHASRVSLGQQRDGSLELTRNAASPTSNHDSRSSMETNRFGGITGGVMRKGSQLSKKSANSPGKHHLLRGQGGHERTGSVLSENTRSMLGAFHDSYVEGEEDEQSIQEAQDEFDALVRSGETMKVSLTPSRLKNFDGSANRRKTNQSPNPSISAKSARSENITPSQFPTPPSTQPRSTTTESPNRAPTLSDQHRSPVLSGRPRADSAQRRLQARTASTIEENEEDREILATQQGSKKESLLELLASEGAYEPTSPTKKSGFRTLNSEKIIRTVPAVVLGTPPPPAPESTFSSPSKIDRDRAEQFSPQNTTNTSSPSNYTQSQSTSPQSVPVNDFSPQPTLTRSQYSSSSLNRPNGRSREASLGGDDDDEDYSFPGQRKSKKKTEAQELADFFNNTPPPTSSPVFKSPETVEEEFQEPPQTAKPGKGFRALVSKVVAKQSKKDKSPSLTSSSSLSKLNSSISRSESNNTNLAGGPKISGWAGFEDPDSQPQLGSGGGMGMPKKQKSLHSLSTVPMAFRPFATEDDFANADSRNDKRKGSTASRTSDSAREAAARFNERRGSAAGISDRRGSAAGINGDRRGSAAGISGDRRGSATGLSGERRGSAVASISERRGSQNIPATHSEQDPSDFGINGDKRGSVNRKMVGLGIASVSEVNGGSSTVTNQPPVLGKTIPSSGQGHQDNDRGNYLSSGTSETRPDLGVLSIPGSATSFKTAHSILSPHSTINTTNLHGTRYLDNSGNSSPVKSISSQSKSTSTDDVIIPKKPTFETGVQTPPSPPPEPSISLNDLIPLRNLLDHSTSVMECRLLLDAILSQVGVPREEPFQNPSQGSTGQSEGRREKAVGQHERIKVGPEDRVTAWLLAGRDGPVGDISRGRGDLTPTPKPIPETANTENAKEALPISVPKANDEDIFSESENTITDYDETENETDNETGVIVDRINERFKNETSSPVKLVRGGNEVVV